MYLEIYIIAYMKPVGMYRYLFPWNQVSTLDFTLLIEICKMLRKQIWKFREISTILYQNLKNQCIFFEIFIIFVRKIRNLGKIWNPKNRGGKKPELFFFATHFSFICKQNNLYIFIPNGHTPKIMIYVKSNRFIINM